MNKTELLHWLQQQNRQWEAFLDQIGEERMDQPGCPISEEPNQPTNYEDHGDEVQ